MNETTGVCAVVRTASGVADAVLAGVRSQTRPPDTVVLVGRQAAAEVRSAGDVNVTLVVPDRGPARALADGALWARARGNAAVWLLAHGAVPEPDALATLVAGCSPAKEDAGRAYAASAVLTPDGEALSAAHLPLGAVGTPADEVILASARHALPILAATFASLLVPMQTIIDEGPPTSGMFGLDAGRDWTAGLRGGGVLLADSHVRDQEGRCAVGWRDATERLWLARRESFGWSDRARLVAALLTRPGR